MNKIEDTTEQSRHDKLKICEYCGDKIKLEDRLQVQIKGFKRREYNQSLSNPYIILSRNYHRKCYIERYKDYLMLKEQIGNGS